MIIEITINYNI